MRGRGLRPKPRRLAASQDRARAAAPEADTPTAPTTIETTSTTTNTVTCHRPAADHVSELRAVPEEVETLCAPENP